jgi:ketosteroid isomerase-like protein
MDEQINKSVATKFYQAFADRDIETMVSCYQDDITFEDPAFGHLEGKHASNMWRMLLAQGDKDLIITFGEPKIIGNSIVTNWEAVYKFSKTSRIVHNKITATMTFEDGKIKTHKDVFNIWKWSRMALGTTGLLLGFTPIVKNKIRSQALKSLHKFESSLS